MLRKKDFNTDYIGKYKDQKAYSYFDSGFFGSIFVYEANSKQRENIASLCSDFKESQAVLEHKQLCIFVKKIDENEAIFYQHGALVGRLLRNVQPCYCYCYPIDCMSMEQRSQKES